MMINLTTVRQIFIQEIVVCMRAERVKKTLRQNEQPIFKTSSKYAQNFAAFPPKHLENSNFLNFHSKIVE